jgi:NADPH2:quinone reductase
MKAAVIHRNGGPEELVYEDLPDPVCADDGIVIDVDTVSVEGGDLLARLMTPPLSAAHVVGYIAAGTVRAIGAKVKGRRLGERVVTLAANGSHAQQRAVSAAMVWAVPDGLAMANAACVPVAFATAHDCLFNAGGLKAGQTVLIHAGAGGVGMAAIQMAKKAGATVIATASSSDKLARLKDFGLDHGINYVEQDFVAEVLALTAQRGVDVVVDSVGGKTLTDSVKVLGWRGRLVSVGIAGRGGSAVNAFSLWAKNNTLHGVLFATALQNEYPRAHALVGDCLQRVASGELRVVIDRSFPLAEAAQAHAWIEGRHAFGRVVMSAR